MTNKCAGDAPEYIKEALCIIGDKWSALILRQLHSGPRRFKDFETEIEGINPRTLSQRLEMLSNAGIIEKTNEQKSSYHSYQLTQKGTDFDEVIHAMAKWGKQHS